MKKKKNFTLGKDWTTQFQLHTLMLPGTVCIIVFSILPLFGLILAFKNYSVVEGVAGIFTSKWYGFQNFKIIFGNHDFTRMLVNTLGINLLGNLINIPAALFFALLINEIASPFLKKIGADINLHAAFYFMGCIWWYCHYTIKLRWSD